MYRLLNLIIISALMVTGWHLNTYAAKKTVCTAAIIKGAADGKFEAVKKELAKGINPDCVYLTGNSEEGRVELTPLMITAKNAVFQEHIQIAALLMKSGADINTKNSFGGTALAMAALNGHERMTEFLIKNGAELNVSKGFPLNGAATNGHKAVVRLLLDNGADVNIRDVDGTTPLYGAILNHRDEIINMLLEKGADVNVKGYKTGETILHHAARYSDTALIKRLLSLGADPGAVDNYGESVLIVLLKNLKQDDIEAVKILAESGANVNAAIGITASGRNSGKNGTDVNTGTAYGFTPLMQAVKGNRSAEIIKYLISRGADVNARDDEGNTPLSLASRNKKIADILLQAGAKD